jgi:hypothetical protein
MQPTTLDFIGIREERQNQNDKIVFDSIKNSNFDLFKKSINNDKYKLWLNKLNTSKEEIFLKCQTDDMFCLLFSGIISKISSRQGSRDEQKQLEVCNNISQHYGIIIENLSNDGLRPTVDGEIITKSEMISRNIPKDCTLKSFDARINGVINGFLSAKVVMGSGGHQDNVFMEIDELANWWKTFKSISPEILVLLIDTNLNRKFDKIKEKYRDVSNIKVFNHITFQNYIIENYQILN